ncbi:hypothetical protein [Shewanella psychrophila]|uniref:hypothetical protein n=1 Tax=Shewanella psychrophila TaxID=225848 RepID=UPI001C54DC8D|nr:hypothetical protein [Shewanella psychrophila]
MLSHFKHQEVVGHWHNDMPGVLPSTKILASSAACPRQIFEYSELMPELLFSFLDCLVEKI